MPENDLGGAYGIQTAEDRHTGFLWGNQKESTQLEDTAINGMTMLICIFGRNKRGERTGFIWLSNGARGGLF
jgi:hypothetical protein